MNEFMDSLKVGDEVAIKRCHTLEWGYDTYFYDYGKIEKITPKRTKFIINGEEVKTGIYPITKDTDKANALYWKRKEIRSLIWKIKDLSVKKIKNDDLDTFLKCLKTIIETTE